MNRRIVGFTAVVLALILLPFFLWEQAIADISATWIEAGRPPTLIAVAIVLLLALDVVLPTPSSLVSASAGVYFGFVTAFLLIATGMIIGCFLGYLLGRTLSRRVLAGMLTERDIDRTSAFFRRHGLLALTLARPLPVLAEASVIFAGATRLSLATVIAYTIPANLLIALAYAGGMWTLKHAPANTLITIGVALIPGAVTAVVFHRARKQRSKRVEPAAGRPSRG